MCETCRRLVLHQLSLLAPAISLMYHLSEEYHELSDVASGKMSYRKQNIANVCQGVVTVKPEGIDDRPTAKKHRAKLHAWWISNYGETECE